MTTRELLHEKLNICEEVLSKLAELRQEQEKHQELFERTNSLLDGVLEETSQGIDKLWDNGEDMTNETNHYNYLLDKQKELGG